MDELCKQVQALNATVGNLVNTVANQQQQLNDLSQAVRALQSPPALQQAVQIAPPLQVVVEPKMPLPEKFSGHRNDFRNFRNRCLSYFEMRPVSSGNEMQKITLIKTLLQGDSQTWAYNLSPQHDALRSVKDFFEAMAIIYDDPDIEATALRKLRNLRQGHGSVEDFAAEFRKWASISVWEPNALRDQFLFGLSDKVSELLLGHPDPRSLEEAISLAIKLDRRIRYHKQSRPHSLSRSSFASTSSSYVPSDEPMQLGHTKLSNSERQRRRQEGLCMYCGEKGHLLQSCSKRPETGKKQPENFSA